MLKTCDVMTMTSIKQEFTNDANDNREATYSSHNEIEQLARSWENNGAISPNLYLSQLLHSRNYDFSLIPFAKDQYS